MTHNLVLIIDNNDSHRLMIKKIIEPLNVSVVEASDGKAGVSSALQHQPDVIISDTRMPGVGGIDVCRLLKQNSDTQSIPVILVGSFEEDCDIGMGFKAGAAAYIKKNEAKSKLPGAVRSLLEKKHTSLNRLILVVDDSASVREMLSTGLTNEGYRIITAENGRAALDSLSIQRPDLILSDIYMPEMNGFTLCETLHSDPEYSSIPFVVMSTEGDAGNMKRMMQYGAASFIVKPFNLEQLLVVLEKIFSFQFFLLMKEKERLDSEHSLLIAGIASLVKALEARDTYTRGHSERVAEILSALVEMSGGSKADVARSLIGGKLHDIGKIGIRDDVLLKPGRLTEEEFNHIKQHPTIGESILISIESIVDILPIVSSHHERIDGNGYPNGLKGDKIPLWARMTAVADTFDALTSDRPYRKGMPDDKAFQIVEDVRGTQLCPDCVDLFFKWYPTQNTNGGNNEKL